MRRPGLLDGPGSFTSKVAAKLAAGEPVRLPVPGGRLHIDRPLPFLCLYRHEGSSTPPAAALVQAQGSYLVATAEPAAHDALAQLVGGVLGLLADEFGSVLLLELWTRPPEEDRPDPAYQILTPERDHPATVDALVKQLADVRALGRIPDVEVLTAAVAPPGLRPVLSPAAGRKLGCLHLGLAVPEYFLDPSSGIVYPIVLRMLQRDLARALQEAFFEFTQMQTTFSAEDYRALGRRSLVEAVGEVDERLTELAGRLDFLPAITPVNTEEAWAGFSEEGFRREPVFHYRPLAVDPDVYRRALYDLPIEKVEDPTLAALLRAKRRELDDRVSMLEERGTRRFLHTSLQVYGGAEDELLNLARRMLEHLRALPPAGADPTEDGVLDGDTAGLFADLARAEIAWYRRHYAGCTAEVLLRDDVPGVMVVGGNVIVGTPANIDRGRLHALVQHEVGTHVVTYFNGAAQPLRLLAAGLPGHEETQEGLAVFAEHLVGGLTRSRLTMLAARVLAVDALCSGASFRETHVTLRTEAGMSARTAFGVAMRVFRSGGLTKDALYLRGLVAMLRHVAEGAPLEPLLVGKLALADAKVVEELQWRGVLSPVPLRPRWLDEPGSAARLEDVRRGLTVLDLVEGSLG